MEEKRLEYLMVTFLGNPVSFTGKQLQVGDKALDFSLTTTDLSKKSLADFDGKKKVLSVVPSIDTGICVGFVPPDIVVSLRAIRIFTGLDKPSMFI